MLRLLPFSCSMRAERTLLSGRESRIDARLGGWKTVERWRRGQSAPIELAVKTGLPAFAAQLRRLRQAVSTALDADLFADLLMVRRHSAEAFATARPGGHCA